MTDESIIKSGFKKINNSMWRYKNITLQNGHVNDGGTLIERIMSEKKAFKVCVNGVFLTMITNLNELNEVVEFHGK